MLSGELHQAAAQAQFAPGALLHYGQGKWYPGEPLPRWALGCYWRKDGVPIWKDDSLIADESKDYGFGAQGGRGTRSRASPRSSARTPNISCPAYEDAFITPGRSAGCPSNVTPEKSNLKDKLERDRIARIFQQGLGAVVGYALPIKRACFGNQPAGCPARGFCATTTRSG